MSGYIKLEGLEIQELRFRVDNRIEALEVFQADLADSGAYDTVKNTVVISDHVEQLKDIQCALVSLGEINLDFKTYRMLKEI